MTTTVSRLQADVMRLFADALKMRFLHQEKANAEEWRAGFEAMGLDPEVCDVEYMLPAAREVVFGDGH